MVVYQTVTGFVGVNSVRAEQIIEIASFEERGSNIDERNIHRARYLRYCQVVKLLPTAEAFLVTEE